MYVTRAWILTLVVKTFCCFIAKVWVGPIDLGKPWSRSWSEALPGMFMTGSLRLQACVACAVIVVFLVLISMISCSVLCALGLSYSARFMILFGRQFRIAYVCWLLMCVARHSDAAHNRHTSVTSDCMCHGFPGTWVAFTGTPWFDFILWSQKWHPVSVLGVMEDHSFEQLTTIHMHDELFLHHHLCWMRKSVCRDLEYGLQGRSAFVDGSGFRQWLILTIPTCSWILASVCVMQRDAWPSYHTPCCGLSAFHESPLHNTHALQHQTIMGICQAYDVVLMCAHR